MKREEIAEAMTRTGFFGREDVVPEPAWKWIDTFIEAYGQSVHTPEEALSEIAALRAESVIVPALALERLRSRQALFYLDAVGQYVDDQPELRGLPLSHDLLEIAKEFGLTPQDALWAVRTALAGKSEGAPLELLFPLLGHDRILMRIGAISSHLLHGRGLEPIKYGPGGEPFTPLHGAAEPTKCSDEIS
jgi:hypothetical protein